MTLVGRALDQNHAGVRTGRFFASLRMTGGISLRCDVDPSHPFNPWLILYLGIW
jgi:hypothetical protein